ncbi:MAG: YbaK/EbsC family protein [Chloroflexi bacterium]|nr:YbaK/EbsC family protein [Chloroflexota bacterium]
MNSVDLTAFINEHDIKAEIVHLATGTPTVASAAEAVGAEPDQIIKSVLFLADGEPVLAIASGTARIAWKQLADYLGVSRRRLKIANVEKALAITGYVVGSVPPFGHKSKLRTIVETSVYDQPFVYGGGGETNALMRLETTELRRIVGQETAQLND